MSGDNTFAFAAPAKENVALRAPAEADEDAAAPEPQGRFTVKINDPSTGTPLTLNNSYRLYVDDCVCTVSGLHGNGVIHFFTPSGQNVMTSGTSIGEMSFTLTPGFFIVIIHEDDKEFTSKILIK